MHLFDNPNHENNLVAALNHRMTIVSISMCGSKSYGTYMIRCKTKRMTADGVKIVHLNWRHRQRIYWFIYSQSGWPLAFTRSKWSQFCDQNACINFQVYRMRQYIYTATEPGEIVRVHRTGKCNDEIAVEMNLHFILCTQRTRCMEPSRCEYKYTISHWRHWWWIGERCMVWMCLDLYFSNSNDQYCSNDAHFNWICAQIIIIIYRLVVVIDRYFLHLNFHRN